MKVKPENPKKKVRNKWRALAKLLYFGILTFVTGYEVCHRAGWSGDLMGFLMIVVLLFILVGGP